MAIESALLTGGSSITLNPAPRRNEAAAEQTNPVSQTSAQTQKDGVELEVNWPGNTGSQNVMDRVSANQQARESVNQVQDSLVQQQALATTTAELPADERSGLQAQQAELQSSRTQNLTENAALEAGNISPLADVAASLTSQGLVGPADPLPDANQLGAGIEQLGTVQATLNEVEVALQAEFTQSQSERLQNPAAAISNPSEAEAVLSRVLEQQSELPRASNAIDDAQRQQTLNLLTV